MNRRFSVALGTGGKADVQQTRLATARKKKMFECWQIRQCSVLLLATTLIMTSVLAPATAFASETVSGAGQTASFSTANRVAGIGAGGKNSSAVNVKGWYKFCGAWYYLDNKGKLARGWKNIAGKTYYFNSAGAMQSGWQQIGGGRYYFGGSDDGVDNPCGRKPRIRYVYDAGRLRFEHYL
jgi:hypothetical protein